MSLHFNVDFNGHVQMLIEMSTMSIVDRNVYRVNRNLNIILKNSSTNSKGKLFNESLIFFFLR